MTSYFLDLKSVAPDNDQYQLIERASRDTWQDMQALGSKLGLALHWSYGDSARWTLLYSAPNEGQIDTLLGSPNLPSIASDIHRALSRKIALKDDFRLILDLDSDERVRGAEGWQARMRGPTGPERHRAFTFNDGAASLAAN